MSIARLVSRKTEEKAEAPTDPFEVRLGTLAKASAPASGRPSLFAPVRKSPSHREA